VPAQHDELISFAAQIAQKSAAAAEHIDLMTRGAQQRGGPTGVNRSIFKHCDSHGPTPQENDRG
jgi:hypothetical protein